MFSNPRAEKVRRPLSGCPLRTRLIAAMVALLAVVCLVVSGVTVVALRHALMARLDSQLAQAGSRAAGPPGGGPEEEGPGPPRRGRTYCNLAFLGNDPGALGACVSGGQTTAQVVVQNAWA
jgi:two-component system, OmpR family, sensor kinase